MASSADEVEVTLGDGNSFKVHLHGATVISWKHKGIERLFVSKQAVFNNKKAIRGGIPVVFPCFGPWDLGPQHGFARTSRWTLESKDDKPTDGAIKVVLSLEDSEETRKTWDHKFKVTYTLALKETEFAMDFVVDNKGDNAFSFTALLHTYLGVEDVTKTTVSNLKGLEYVDKVRGGETFTEDRELVSLAENYDRVYKNTPNEHVVKDAASGRTVAVRKTNFPDTVVWNPWEEKAKAMSDFGDDEYPKMLCVEAGHVSSSVTLNPGETFKGSQVLAVVQ